MLTKHEIKILTHFSLLGRMSASPSPEQDPLIDLGLLERFESVVGSFNVPRVRITEAGRNWLRSNGIAVREPAIIV